VLLLPVFGLVLTALLLLVLQVLATVAIGLAPGGGR
jgi:hypothetical protein